jgi:predicted Rossmann fold flavoprotein
VKKVVGEGIFSHIELQNGTKVEGDACIIATGGFSYQTTGSTGDGYEFAKRMGHEVTEVLPSLVPLRIREWYAKELQGLSLRNVSAAIWDEQKKLYEDFGEMLFTHYGVSGPLMLSASSYIAKRVQERELKLVLDLKPALSFEQLDQRVLRDFEENMNKQFKNAVGKLFPTKLIPIMIELSGIDPEKKVNLISKEERQQFVHLIKHFTMTITGLQDFNEAIITKGGVNVKEIKPSTMESKLVSGLYFVGEVLDLDALTGGFNLQIAWSTAYAAGSSIY